MGRHKKNAGGYQPKVSALGLSHFIPHTASTIKEHWGEWSRWRIAKSRDYVYIAVWVKVQGEHNRLYKIPAEQYYEDIKDYRKTSAARASDEYLDGAFVDYVEYRHEPFVVGETIK